MSTRETYDTYLEEMMAKTLGITVTRESWKRMSPFERYQTVADSMPEQEVQRLLANVSGRYFSIPLGGDVGKPETIARKRFHKCDDHFPDANRGTVLRSDNL